MEGVLRAASPEEVVHVQSPGESPAIAVALDPVHLETHSRKRKVANLAIDGVDVVIANPQRVLYHVGNLLLVVP